MLYVFPHVLPHIRLDIFPSILNFESFLGNTGKDFPGIVIADEPMWKNSIQGSNAVVNLAGTPISTRWSPEVILQTKSIALNLIFAMLILELAFGPWATQQF